MQQHLVGQPLYRNSAMSSTYEICEGRVEIRLVSKFSGFKLLERLRSWDPLNFCK
jgi:hypothetical protein